MANEEKMDFAAEFPEGAEEALDTTMPEEGSVAADATERATYTLADGTEGSRAAFIREKFLDDNMSRKEISEKFDLPYRVVYSATVNMTNSAEGSPRGRTSSASTITVTVEGNQLVVVKDDGTYVDGEKIAEGTVIGETKSVERNTWIREKVESGTGRGDIAKMLDLSYGVIYGVTKELQEGAGHSRIMVTLDDGTEVSRSEYIRMQYAAGVTRGDIAKNLDVPYSVVWQATKENKTDADRLADAIENLKTFADKVEDADLFGQVLAALATITLKAETADTAEAAEAEAPKAE